MAVPARTQLGIITAASLAGLLFGFDTAVISGVTQSLRELFGLSPEHLGLAVSAALWGTLLGALTLGRPGDRFGARAGLKFIAALYLVAALGAALAWNLSSFVVFRFLTGVAIGGSSILAPVYIAEIASTERRGARVGLFQFNIVLGILLAYVSNFLIDRFGGGGDAWRYKLAVPAAPALVFLLLLQSVPRSPRWLIAKGRLSEAEQTLSRLGVRNPAETMAEIAAEAADRGHTDAAKLSWRLHRKPIVLAIAVAMFNQLSGINAILYYLGDIFAAAGFNTVSANAQSIAIGVTNLAATVVAMAFIDRVGRRRLLLLGSVGTALAQGAVAVIMALGTARALLLPLLVVFIASFAGSQGAVIWVYLSEIFPTAVRARGQGLGSAVHWTLNALIAGLFPAIAARSVAIPFAFFSVMMLLQFVFVLRYLPETRGISLERMQRALGGTA
jgi:sugar porter (SP) family MFS transporter